MICFHFMRDYVAKLMASTAMAATAGTLDLLPRLKLILWNPTDTHTPKIGILRLDASKAAKILIARLLPLCN